MSLNYLNYSIYLLILVPVILRVGHLVHRNGAVYLLQMLQNIALAHSLNNLLLIGYYLLNLGFALFYMVTEPKLQTVAELLSQLTTSVGSILLILGLLHFINLGWIYALQKRNSIFNSKYP